METSSEKLNSREFIFNELKLAIINIGYEDVSLPPGLKNNCKGLTVGNFFKHPSSDVIYSLGQATSNLSEFALAELYPKQRLLSNDMQSDGVLRELRENINSKE